MSILQYPNLIPQSLYTQTWQDALFNQLNSYYQSEGTMFKLVNQGWMFEERGKDATCIWDQSFFWQIVIQYLINMKSDIIKASSQTLVDLVISSYDLPCVRNYVLCGNGNVALFDQLVQIAGVNGQLGLDFLIQEGTNNNFPDFIIV